jgi:hypothetical protein
LNSAKAPVNGFIRYCRMVAKLFAIATNACLHDHEILAHTVPSWLRVFGNKLSNVWIIVDTIPPSGRIGNRGDIESNSRGLQKCLLELSRADSRIRFAELSDIPLEQLSRQWFGEVISARCQAGTPILPFVAAFQASGAELVLRTDCDMLFCDRGWWTQACELLSNDAADLVEPPHCGMGNRNGAAVSTRALMMSPDLFASRCLPIKACRLDWLRRLHRRLHNRDTFLAFEQMLEFERKRGRLRHVMLDNSLGYSIHVHDRRLSSWDPFAGVVQKIEIGELTEAQWNEGWNFARAAW